jgi:hypothetical protein
MKLSTLASTGLFVLGALIMLTQLWFSLWSPETFNKVIITVSVLFIVSIVLSFVFKEAADTQNLKSGKDL